MNASKSTRCEQLQSSVSMYIFFSFPLHSIRVQMGQRARARNRSERRRGRGGRKEEEGREGKGGGEREGGEGLGEKVEMR